MKIGILTSSRADFGIYLPLIKALQNDPLFSLEIIAFGTHLSPFHGYTLKEIEREGVSVNYKVESLLLSDSKEAISTSVSLTMIKFSSFWQEHGNDFDIVFCLGDRFEMFGAVLAGVPFQIKFAHIHGGEKTLGAIDNVFRHSISHAAQIHFVSTPQYLERLHQMLDDSRNVHYIGALSLDNLSNIPFLSPDEFQQKWGINLSIPTILTTFHPETVRSDLNAFYAEVLVKVILSTQDFQFIITMPNADTAGATIRRVFEERLSKNKRVFLIENFGTQSYFTAMKFSRLLLGNSSSGIVEAASFGKYVINLGDRQEGRVAGENVFHVEIEENSIKEAILKLTKMPEYSEKNIYYKAGAAKSILSILKKRCSHE